MSKSRITAHMIVKNDDRWVWFAIQSIINSVDRLIIYDTGSTDRSVVIIKTIKHPKIDFSQHKASTASDISYLRQRQLQDTRTPWVWLIDADEIYTKTLCEEITNNLSAKYIGIIVKRRDLLGDIYHYQSNETVGGYNLFGELAHHSLRLINLAASELSVVGDYPNEAYVDAHKTPLIKLPRENFYFTKNRYIHTTYLNRSTLGKELKNTFHRRKYKTELGSILPQSELPEVFFKPHPSIVSNPLIRRPMAYTLEASLITPLKIIKRKYFK